MARPQRATCRPSRIGSSAATCDDRDRKPPSARGRRIEAPFEGAIIPGILRAPRGASRPPVVILVPGLDSVKEELYAMENDFLRRGLATLTIDGPGQGENAPRFPIRADWSSVVSPLLDHLSADERGLDLGRVGLMGISMGGIYGPRAAAKEKRLRAIVALAGPYDLAECSAADRKSTRLNSSH